MVCPLGHPTAKSKQAGELIIAQQECRDCSCKALADAGKKDLLLRYPGRLFGYRAAQKFDTLGQAFNL